MFDSTPCPQLDCDNPKLSSLLTALHMGHRALTRHAAHLSATWLPSLALPASLQMSKRASDLNAEIAEGVRSMFASADDPRRTVTGLDIRRAGQAQALDDDHRVHPRCVGLDCAT